MTEPAHTVKKQQLIYACIAGGMGLVMVAGLIWCLGGEGAFDSKTPSAPVETNIMTAGQRVNPQEIWVERVESENKLTQEKIKDLESLIDQNNKDTDHTKGRMNHKCLQNKSCSGAQEAIYDNENEEDEIPEPYTNTLPVMSEPLQQQQIEGAPISQPGLGKIILKLSNRILPGSVHSGKPSVEKSTLENTLPAGAFAKAILLGGVDASTSVSSSSDPRPVLLRVTDHGTLPRKFKSDLKACHILASSYGDLSSERVYMRLEKLTCTERLTGEISETQVSGYIVGEDGRTGVRGIVADKAGPLIRNSLVGGFFSGMGQFFSAQQQKTVFPVTLPGQIPAMAPQQMLMSGASQGVSNAFEKYAEFFIKRAEQLQPVLQIAAGREVDVVFTQGTRFGETTVKKSLGKIRDRSRKAALQDLEEQSDTQTWIPNNTSEGDE